MSVYVVLLGALSLTQGAPRDQEKPFLSPLLSESVDLTSNLVESHAGYQTVSKLCNYSFSYFPSRENAKKAPVLVWLESGVYGRNGNFERVIHTWALNHHVIYIDNLIHSGFGERENNRTQVVDELYSSLTQLFEVYPELKKNGFFIAGECYSSKYALLLAHFIHLSNPSSKTEINLQGIIIGNGWCDYKDQVGLIKYLKQNVWKDGTQVKTLKNVDHIENKSIKPRDINIITQDNEYIHDYDDSYESVEFLVGKYVQKFIHIEDHQSDEVFNDSDENFVQSMISDLLEHYSVTTYSGLRDFQVPYGWKVDILRALPFSGAEEYACAPELMWRVKGSLAGYVRTAKASKTTDDGKVPAGFTEVLVRGDGHVVSGDEAGAHDLITRFTYGLPFN